MIDFVVINVLNTF